MRTSHSPSFRVMRVASVAVVTSLVGVLHATTASATNGFLSHCVGANNCGMGGAGIALPQDATSGALNPALMARVGNQLTVSPGWFHPERYRDMTKVTNSNPVNPAAKKNEDSQVTDFMEGSAGVNYDVAPDWTVGLVAYGSGGMHTKYTVPRMQGGAGDSEVRFRLAHFAPTLTYSPTEKQSYGVSLIIGYQDFRSNFATMPINAETAGGLAVDRAIGVGGRIGGLWDVTDQVSIGFAANTPVFFQKFEKYDDLFLGAINTPMQAGIGLNWKVLPGTDIAFDAKYIAWGTEEVLHKRPGSGGFGWQSEPVFAIGVQHALTEATTVRVGWNYGPTPIADSAVFANAMFPAVTEHHFTVGAAYKFNEKWELAGSAFYAPENSLTDSGDPTDAFSGYGKNTEIGMWQAGAQVGLTWKF